MSRASSIHSVTPQSVHSDRGDGEKVTLQTGNGGNLYERLGTLKRQASSIPDYPYSIFSRRQKGIIVAIVSLAALFSPFTINIYYPAILDIASDMGVTISLMNLTITI